MPGAWKTRPALQQPAKGMECRREMPPQFDGIIAHLCQVSSLGTLAGHPRGLAAANARAWWRQISLIHLEFPSTWVKRILAWRSVSGLFFFPEFVRRTYLLSSPSVTSLSLLSWGKGVLVQKFSLHLPPLACYGSSPSSLSTSLTLSDPVS